MKKILIISCNGLKKESGITTVLMNYYNYMDKTDIVVDIAGSDETSSDLLEMIHKGGGKYIPLEKRNKCFRYMLDVYKNVGKYDVVHIHGNSATMLLEVLPAYIAGVGKRIVHCHASRCDHRNLSRLAAPLFNVLYTDAIACSGRAGAWLYGKNNYVVLNNALLPERYQYNDDIRKSIRIRYAINDDTIVIGHVGSISIPKNHELLINLFEKYHSVNKNSKLLLVGDGPLRHEIVDLIKEKKIEKSVIMTGYINDAEHYFNAMDCFVFPSRYEGLGSALVEAQVNGLKCFASSEVPKEADISGNVCFISLQEPVETWSRLLLQENFQREPFSDIKEKLIERGFDIVQEVKKLKKLYLA